MVMVWVWRGIGFGVEVWAFKVGEVEVWSCWRLVGWWCRWMFLKAVRGDFAVGSCVG